MADPARAAKLAQRIKVVVAEALGRRVKDPRLEGVTVTDARVTNDLQHATVYYTVFGDETAQADAAKGLEKAKGVLRQEVGRNITVRLTPTLEFVADQIPVVASNLEELLREAKKRDAEVAALAAGAKHAGDADPYKSDIPDDVELDDEDFDEDDFDEENHDLRAGGDIDEDSNK
ncbi:30S ribosome-binding factor RbfA [Arthrobacter sp. NPDC080082]|uniref:30S ribosome-binding factor RbfA n=1 Tax=unclassified Arthrobacter TaxID=235627 RepID=UPI0034466092